MEKNTKILLGLAAIVVAYLVLRPKKSVAEPLLVGNQPDGSLKMCNAETDLCWLDLKAEQLKQINDIESEFVKINGRASKNGDTYKFYTRTEDDNIPKWTVIYT
jgi:hypothetical protein